MSSIAIGVAIAVISTVIVAAGKWLLDAENRDTVRQRFRETTCSHEWEPISDVVISPDREWCVRCGARRT